MPISSAMAGWTLDDRGPGACLGWRKQVTPVDSQARLYVSGQPPGALPNAGRASGNQRWWETDYGAWRRNAEREAMARHFPAFTLCEMLDGSLSWVGWLRSGLDSGAPDNRPLWRGDPHERRYQIRVIYPDNFPEYPPSVVIESPELPQGMPHVLAPQRPCLFQPAQGPRNGYDPGKTTAATLVAWTALWIHAFETWQATGHWPGRSD
jgi:hypothetical protein